MPVWPNPESVLLNITSIQGALLASLGLQALNLPLITSTSFLARGALTVSCIFSILATFFTLIQQRELSVVRSAAALRAWLSNGVQYKNGHEILVFQSSWASLNLLEGPYEFLSMAIMTFILGIAAYLGSAWLYKVDLHASDGPLADLSVILAFSVVTGFSFFMFPLLLGTKDRESNAVGGTLIGFERQPNIPSAGEETSVGSN